MNTSVMNSIDTANEGSQNGERVRKRIMKISEDFSQR